jgi:hypothetical protein
MFANVALLIYAGGQCTWYHARHGHWAAIFCISVFYSCACSCVTLLLYLFVEIPLLFHNYITCLLVWQIRQDTCCM